MKIEDFKQTYYVESQNDLERIFSIRYNDDVNEFWLSFENDSFPILSVLINNNLASIHFFSQKGHPGFRSLGKLKGIDPMGTTLFFTNSGSEEAESPNE